jgi:hypothetical protein
LDCARGLTEQEWWRRIQVAFAIGATQAAEDRLHNARGGGTLARPKTSELSNSLSNLGRNPGVRNATILAEYGPGPTTVFSGVYSPETGQFLLRPSGNTRLATGAVPANLVDRAGGHGVVNRELGELANIDTGKTVGFVVYYETEGQLTVRWQSGSVNLRNYNDRLAPTQYRQPIIDALQESTGLQVTSR